jgi:hypothetical protein
LLRVALEHSQHPKILTIGYNMATIKITKK